ncbi:MAG: hypothetical protein R3C14_40155 [Caldilineaceae bacterium]
MTVLPQTEVVTPRELIAQLTQSRRVRLAYWISQLGSPPLTAAGAALLIGFTLSSAFAWRWTLVYMVLTILAPCGYIIWLVQTGQVSDFHLPKREQRFRPLLFSLVAAIVAWLLLVQVAAPRLLQILGVVNLLQTALFFVITLYWKISLHTAAATILAELALVLLGPGAVLFTLSVPLIAWSRIHLERHTVEQTIGGALLGIGILTPMLLLYIQ